MSTVSDTGRLRIVLLVGAMSVGGAERVAATLANAWRARGAKVCLVPTYLGSREVAYDVAPGVSIEFLGDWIRMGGAGPAAGFLAKRRALRALVRHLEPDVVVSFLTNVNVLAVAALLGTGIPLVVSERTHPAADVELHWALHGARCLTYPFADAFVVQTRAAEAAYARRIPLRPRTVVIPNPVPAQLESSALRADHRGDGGRIVALGRLMPSKGFDKLIRAFAREFSDRPEWRLCIWGDGPARDELATLVHNLGIVDRVALEGATRTPWTALASGQIFALPSAYEGFPNAMLEAMALGLACVAFDCPAGPRELAGDGSAAVVLPPGDEEALGRALRELADSPVSRRGLGELAARVVRESFSESVVLELWNAVLMRACARGRHRRSKSTNRVD